MRKEKTDGEMTSGRSKREKEKKLIFDESQKKIQSVNV